jgi:hypothetical protein
VTQLGVEIRPEVAIYAAFARLNYRPWYALSEFVDNAVQSYLSNKAELTRRASGAFVLQVAIDINPDFISIRDNAAGIAGNDFARAFLPASPPNDTTGLSEFGLGMKAAACWFSRRWFVETTALNDSVQRTISFDIPNIVAAKIDRLPVAEAASPTRAHGTLVMLENLAVKPQAKTIAKIKAHLASIYRMFLKTGEVRIEVNGDQLSWEVPKLLEAPYYETESAGAKRWYREFSLELDSEHRVWGWAGLLARASVLNAGFSVFRRKRLIEGSYGEAFRPAAIFRGSNSYTYQRLIGELNVDGFSVSHTKDGVQWADWEDDILNWLRAELDKDPTPLLRQAEGFRARPARGALDDETAGIRAIVDVQKIVAQHVPQLIDAQLTRQPESATLPESLPPTAPSTVRETTLALSHGGQNWTVRIELISDESCYDWLQIASEDVSQNPRLVHIRVNTNHPFMLRHATPDHSELDGFIRIAAGLALSEISARAIGVRQAGTIRRNLNELLYSALSAP